jgi:lipopolysaccharide transport protein LptA
MKLAASLFFFGLAFSLSAQTNSVSPDTNTPAAVTPVAVSTNASGMTNEVSFGIRKTEIFSERGQFNMKDRLMIYIDNVRVLDPQMRLTCEIMTVTLPESGRPDRIVAERNVVINGVDNKGQPIHATSDKAIYTYHVSLVTNDDHTVNSVTNEVVSLTGNPRVQQGENWMTGNEITWNRQSGEFNIDHPHMVIQAESGGNSNAASFFPAPEKNKK